MGTKKIALITGGGSGIGLAIAERFCRNNIETIISGRDTEKLGAARKKIGDNCHILPCDLSQHAALPAFVQQAEEQFGPIDILVNNAGINLKKDFTEVSLEEFNTIIATNLTAVFVLSREVARSMQARGGGSIIHISSMAAQYGLPRVIAYSASKSAIDGMTRAMAVELSPKGIRVNAIAPGFIETEMSAKALNSDPERKARVFARTPMGFLGQPSDIGDAALFLTSDAAKYITGVILPVDGGNSIGF